MRYNITGLNEVFSYFCENYGNASTSCQKILILTRIKIDKALSSKSMQSNRMRKKLARTLNTAIRITLSINNASSTREHWMHLHKQKNKNKMKEWIKPLLFDRLQQISSFQNRLVFANIEERLSFLESKLYHLLALKFSASNSLWSFWSRRPKLLLLKLRGSKPPAAKMAASALTSLQLKGV